MTEEEPAGDRPTEKMVSLPANPAGVATATTTTTTTTTAATSDSVETTTTTTASDSSTLVSAPTELSTVVEAARSDEVAAAESSSDRVDPDEPPPEQPSTPDAISTQRVFKKSSSNNKLTIYLGSRDIIIANRCSERVRGVVVVDPDYLQDRKVFGQIILTFRYGREDEEVMGLKFCNEAIMCIAQLYPAHERVKTMPNTPLQDALLRRLGPNAHPFCMEVTPLAPPSVQLVPAKEYTGAPIGTSYDVRAYVADRPEEKVNRRSMVRMGIRILHSPVPPPAPAPAPATPFAPRPPHAAVDKPFLLSDGKVELEASLNKGVYNHGEMVMVNVAVHNNSSRSVRRIKVFVVQHVDVCMFSNGKFKNVVAIINSRDQCPLGPGSSLKHVYPLQPERSATKNWIALEDTFSRGAPPLASTVTCASNSPDDRNVFAIYVSYYVKVKLLVGAMGGELSVKLPFILMHSSYDSDLPCLSSVTCCTDSKAVNGGTEGEGDLEGGGSRRPSAASNRRPPPQQQAEEVGKSRKAQQMKDADVILACEEGGASRRPPPPGDAT